MFRAPSLWYSTIVTQSKTVITPVGKREHPRKCSLLNYPSSSSPRLRPRPPWKRHNHDLFLMAKHLLWWCVGATSWKTLLWNFLETCPLGCQEKPPSGRCCSLEFVMNQTKGVPGEAACCWVLLAALNCRVRSYSSYKVTGIQQKLGRKTLPPSAPLPAKLYVSSADKEIMPLRGNKLTNWSLSQLFILPTSMSLTTSSLLTRFVTLILLALFLFLYRI